MSDDKPYATHLLGFVAVHSLEVAFLALIIAAGFNRQPSALG